MESNYFKWYEEPEFTSVRVEPSYMTSLMDRAISKAKTTKKLSELTGLSYATIYNYKRLISLNIGGLKNVLDFLNIKYNRINHKIRRISWNLNKFDINYNSDEMAIILAASLADGHLNRSHFMYKNKDTELIARVKASVKKLFGNIKINKRVDKNGTPYILCPTIVRKQLEKLGSPRGKKLFRNPRVPEIIRDGTKKQKRLFIQQFFDDEGWVETENLHIAAAQASDVTKALPNNLINKLKLRKPYSTNKIGFGIINEIPRPNLLLDIQKILLKDFNISTNLLFKKITKYPKFGSKEDYISAAWELGTSKREDVQRFYDKIKFYSKRKAKTLRFMLKKRQLPHDIMLKLLNSAIRCHKLNGSFKVKDIQKEINLNRGNIRKRLNTLVNKGLLDNFKGSYHLKLEI